VGRTGWQRGALRAHAGRAHRTGVLEAIPTEDILAGADPDDRDGRGISGRASWVPDLARGTRALGRFGWRAAQPSVEQQIATALREDMGLTSWLRPQTACTPSQRDCAARDHADEVSGQVIFPYTDLLLHDMGSGQADDLA
jgi:CxxC motif-containing protein (DUF1111 family)